MILEALRVIAPQFPWTIDEDGYPVATIGAFQIRVRQNFDSRTVSVHAFSPDGFGTCVWREHCPRERLGQAFARAMDFLRLQRMSLSTVLDYKPEAADAV